MTTASELRSRRPTERRAPSLWSQVTETLDPTTILEGIAGLGWNLVTTDARSVLETPGTIAAGAAGRLVGMDDAQIAKAIRAIPGARFLALEEAFEPYASRDGSGSFGERFSARFGQFFPTLKSFQESGANTWGRLRHPSRYAQASREGRIVPVLLEDIGNVAPVVAGASELGAAGAGRAAAVAPPARAAQLRQIAETLQRVGHPPPRVSATGEIRRGPSPVWGAPSRAAAAVLERTGGPSAARLGAQLRTEGVLRPLARRLAETRPGQAVSTALDELMLSRRTEPVHQMASDVQFDLHTQYAQQLQPLERAARVIEPDIQRAALLRRQGLGSEAVLRPLVRAGYDDAAIAETLRAAVPQDITAESVRIAREALDDTLDEATAAKLQEASEVYETAVGQPRARRYLEGRDEPAPLSEAQRAHRAESVAARGEPLSVVRRQAEELAAQELTTQVTELLNSPEAAPAPLRPVMIASRKIAEGLRSEIDNARSRGQVSLAEDLERMVAELPTDIERAAALQPRYVVGGSVADKVVDLSRGDVIPYADMGAEGLSLLAQWQKLVTEGDPIAALGRKVDDLDEARMLLEESIEDTVGLRPAEIPRVVGEIEDWMRDNGVGRIHVTEGNVFDLPESRRARGPLSRREGVELPTIQRTAESQMRTVGLTPLTFEGQARNIARRMMAGAENAQVRFLDAQHSLTASDFGLEHLRGERLEAAMSEAARERFGWDVRPWDPESKVFDTPSHIGPETKFLPEHIWRAARRLEQGRRSVAGRLLDPVTDVWKVGVLAFRPAWQIGNASGGMLMTTLAGGVTPSELLTYAREAWRKARQATERPWELVDTPEARLFSAHPERAAQRFAISGELGGGGRLRRLADRSFALNEVVDNWFKSVTYMARRGRGYSDVQAVRLALDALPDFRRRWWENKYVKPWLPFEPWLANVSRIAWRLAVDHPVRVAWTLRLGEIYRDAWDEIDWLQGAANLGGDKFLMLGSLNPFGDVPILNPLDIGGNLNPFAKLGLEAVTGVDLSDMSPITRPPGTGWVTPTGRERPQPLLTDPAALAYRAAGIFPQGRAVRDALLAPVERYETGDPIRIASARTGRWREIPTGESRFRSLAEIMGVPLPTEVNWRELLEVRRRRERERAQARQRYSG